MTTDALFARIQRQIRVLMVLVAIELVLSFTSLGAVWHIRAQLDDIGVSLGHVQAALGVRG